MKTEEKRKIKVFVLVLDDYGKVHIQPVDFEDDDLVGFFARLGIIMIDKDSMITYKSIHNAYKKYLVIEGKEIKKEWMDLLAIRVNLIKSRLFSYFKVFLSDYVRFL